MVDVLGRYADEASIHCLEVGRLGGEELVANPASLCNQGFGCRVVL